MTPQEWIKDSTNALGTWPHGEHVAEGAQHLAAALEEIARLREQVAYMDRLVASVPDLVKTAFQEGFSGNAETLGKAWEKSNARKALDGEAQPRPPSWDADKEEIARLKAQLSQVQEDRVVVPELTASEIEAHYLESVHAIPADIDAKEREWCFKDCRWAYNLAASRAHSVPASRVLKDGEVAVDAREFSLLSQHWQLWERVGEDPRPEVEEARLEVIFALTDFYEKRNALRAQGKEGET